MARVADIVIKLNFDNGDFVGKIEGTKRGLRQLEDVASSLGRTLNRTERDKRSWLATLRDATIVLGGIRYALINLDAALLSLPRAIVRVNAEFERMSALMRGLSRETESFEAIQREAVEGMNYLLNMAQTSPYDIEVLGNAFVKLKSAGLDPTNGSMQALVDAIARFGGTRDQMNRAAVAIQQMAGKGAISLEELRQQLGEAVPDAMKIMARSLGISVGELTKVVSTGTLEAQNALTAMLRQMAIESYGSAGEMSKTWDGTMNRLVTRLKLAAKEIGDAGLFDEVKRQLKFITDDLLTSPEFLRSMHQLGQMTAETLRLFAEGVGFVAQYSDAIMMAGVALLGFSQRQNIARAATTALRVAAEQHYALKVRMAAAEAAHEAAIRRTTAAMGAQYLLANHTFNHAIAASIRNAATFRVELERLGHQAKALGGFMGTLGRGLWNALGGWVGVLSAAVPVAIFWYMSLRDEHEKTVRALENLPIRLRPPEQLDKLRQQISELHGSEKQIQALREEIEKLEAAGYDRSTTGVLYARIEHFERRIKELKKQIGDVNNAEAELIRIDREMREKRARDQIEVERNRIEKELRVRLNQFRQEADEIIKNSDLKSAEASRARIRELEQKNVEFIKGEWDKLAQHYQKIIETNARLTSKDAREKVRQAQDMLQAIKQAQQEMLAPYGMNAGGIEILGGANGQSKQQLQDFESYLVSIERRLARIRARNTDSNPFLEEFEAMLEMGRFGTLLPEKIELVREKLRELYEEDQKFRNNQAAERSIREIVDRINNTQASITSVMNRRANTNPWLREQEAANAYSSKIQQLRDELNKLEITEKELADARQASLDRLNELEKQSIDLARRATSEQMAKAAEDIRISLLPEMERVRNKYDQLIENAREWYELNKDAMDPETLRNYMSYIAQLNAQKARELEKPITTLMRDWLDGTRHMDQAWADTMSSFTDTLAQSLRKGKLDFKDFTDELILNLARIQIRLMTAAMAMGITGLFKGGKAEASSQFSFTPDYTSPAGTTPFFTFAKGGVMTKYGEVPLRKYAMGGIARSPQLALFGEGSTPEAFVPLPDGRAIPVRFEDAPVSAGAPQVTFNLINETGQPVQARAASAPYWDGRRMIMDVVLSEVSRPGKFRDAMKQALR